MNRKDQNWYVYLYKNIQKSERAKGQLISKADWCAIDSPKKRTNELGFFAPEILET